MHKGNRRPFQTQFFIGDARGKLPGKKLTREQVGAAWFKAMKIGVEQAVPGQYFVTIGQQKLGLLGNPAADYAMKKAMIGRKLPELFPSIASAEIAMDPNRLAGLIGETTGAIEQLKKKNEEAKYYDDDTIQQEIGHLRLALDALTAMWEYHQKYKKNGPRRKMKNRQKNKEHQ